MKIRALAGAVGLGVLGMAMSPQEARACGGCFHGPTQSGTVITDHRMIFRISPQETTLYDEIEYQGNPASFAWVLPIHGPVTVGLSADVVFAALEAVTQTTIQAPPPPSCPFCGCGEGPGSSSSGGGGFADASAGGGVTVLGQAQVGPYDTVQLSSTDPNALDAWLAANGYSIPPDIQPIIAAYVQEGFDFLALRLAPGQSVQAMRPVRVTARGASLSLPLRMVAAGTGATVGITLWVIADGRYEAANFADFTISSSELVWDWSTESSNYRSLRAQKEMALGNAAWQTESSLQISPYQIIYPVTGGAADSDYLPIAPSDSGAEGGAGQTADEVRQQDLETLFPAVGSGSSGGSYSEVRITRMRADLSHTALGTDLVLQAPVDQSELSNVYRPSQGVNAPACPAVPNPCPPCGGPSGNSASGSGGSGATSGGVASSSGGSGSSSGGSSRGIGGFGGSSGGSGMVGIPDPGRTAPPSNSGGGLPLPSQGSGCSAAPLRTQDIGIDFFAAGVLGATLLRSRRRR